MTLRTAPTVPVRTRRMVDPVDRTRRIRGRRRRRTADAMIALVWASVAAAMTFGHTAESAFRDMYGNLDLEAWFSESCIAPETRVAIETWRGAAASLRPV